MCYEDRVGGIFSFLGSQLICGQAFSLGGAILFQVIEEGLENRFHGLLIQGIEMFSLLLFGKNESATF
jgi:hypothetical protein